MSKIKKILILTLSMVFALVVSASIVSYSLASGSAIDYSQMSTTKSDADGKVLSMADDMADTLTNIDHIIDKANDASLPVEERIFHIVQIVSNGNKNTSMKSYVESGDFRKHVIDANRSSESYPTMPETVNGQESVQIIVLTVADLESLVTTQPLDYSIITQADLVYVSNDPASPYKVDYNKDVKNDIPQDIYNILHTYSDGDDKPLIIDNANVSVTDNKYSMQNLVSNVLAYNYIKYFTFEWKNGVTLEQFLTRENSLYIPLELRTQNYIPKILVVGDGSSNAMRDAINTGNTFKDKAFYRKGYPVGGDPIVDSILYTDIQGADFAKDYDFVFIENGSYSAMTETIYNAISAVSLAKQYVIYAGALKSTNVSGTGDNTNYKTLFDGVVSPEGIALKSNVYVSSYTLFDSMVKDPVGTQEAADEIAALIKSSTYREFGKDSASGKKFTVLEIQPCYPIDEVLADTNKKYYTRPDNVYKMSKEMTPDKADGSRNEYYAFELSIEKIIALFDGKMTADQIDLQQISTEELQGMKTSLVDKYDLIYIGGNTSALTKPENYRFDGSRKLGEFTNDGLAYYGMYSHTGPAVRLMNGLNGTSTGSFAVSGGNDITVTNLTILKEYVDAGMPLVISNVLTDAYRNIGKKYSDNVYKNPLIDPDSNMCKFLTYIFANEVTGDKGEGGDAVALEYSIGSNVAKNVLYDFNKDDTIRVSNTDKKYGNTITAYAEVFSDGDIDPKQIDMTKRGNDWVEFSETANPSLGDKNASGYRLRTLLNNRANANTRPTMNLTSMPKKYVANTPSTYLDSTNLSFEFELLANGNLNISGYTVTLYIDDNANGLFTDLKENVCTVDVPFMGEKTTGALAFDLNKLTKDFYGPVSWKIEAVAKIKKDVSEISGPAMSYAAVSKVARKTSEKALVSILQIMPKSSGTQQDKNTLYFCTECQLSNTNARFNIHLNNASQQTGDKIQFLTGLYEQYKSDTSMVKTLVYDESKGHYGIGLHEHNFGIWKYDKTIGYDDWNSNLADALTGDDGDFEFRIDIYTPQELKSMNDAYCSKSNDVAKLQNEYEAMKASASSQELNAKKKQIKDLEADKVKEAAIQYEEYENLVRVTEDKEEDLRNVLQYFVDNEATLKPKFGNKVLDYSIFAEVLGNRKYYDIFSENKTKWRTNDSTAETNFGRTGWINNASDDGFIVFTAKKKDEAGNLVDTTYCLGVAGKLQEVYINAGWIRLTPEEYVANGGSLDVLDYNKYKYVYDSDYNAGGNGANRAMNYSFCQYYYQRWADAKSAEILALEKYWDMMRAAYGKDWLKEVYGIVLVGAAEDFNDQDLEQSVCDALVDYEKSGGNMLMFHDTMTWHENSGAVNITKAFAEPFGLDRFHMEVASASEYKVKSGYDKSKYFMSTLSYNDVSNYMRSGNFKGSTIGRSLKGISAGFIAYYGGTMQGSQVELPYRYAGVNVNKEWKFYMQDFKTYQTNMASGNYGTNRATQLNSGIITSYPFNIAANLNISGTHGQYLSLDVEDDEVITWYTMAAANNSHDGSSIYAADPGDASDNYFIYSKGNVNYCGAGHAKVTGPLTDNNDERMLFINIICNSARKNALMPSITIYDPDNKKPVPSAGNKYILQNSDGEPYIAVSNQQEKIKFGFAATVDTTASDIIKTARIYFKYLDDDGKEVEEVVRTYPDNANGVDALRSGQEYYVNSADTTANKISDSITLKPEYFNNVEEQEDCAYVYIEVIDSNDNVLIEKIRIDLVRELFDLTMNTNSHLGV